MLALRAQLLYPNRGDLSDSAPLVCPPCAQDLNKESKRIARYRARMEAVDKWMSKRSLPKGLRQRIGQYYQEARGLSSLLHARRSLIQQHGCSCRTA